MPSIHASFNIGNLEQIDDLVVETNKNKNHSTPSNEGFLIRNQHRQITLKIVCIGKVKAK